MSNRQSARVRFIALGIVAVLVVAAYFAVPWFREAVGLVGEQHAAASGVVDREVPAKLIADAAGNQGLQLSQEAVAGLRVEPVAVKKALQHRALPPQAGTVNFDNDRLFSI